MLALFPRQYLDAQCTCHLPGFADVGMTAAIVDETFGGLLLALRQAGALPFWGPAFTASLEVAYKAVRFCLCEGSAGRGRFVLITLLPSTLSSKYAD